ncbi:hypothetical protein CBP27_23740, partial [Fischerella thermalis WC542]
MSESQNPLNSAPTVARGIPPLPPPPPTISTQRQSTQTLEIPVDRSRTTPSPVASPASAHR